MIINPKENIAIPRVDSSKTRIEISCKSAKALLVYFEKKYGKEKLSKFIHNTGMPLDYLENENNWLTFSYYTSLFDRLADYGDDPDILFEAGTYVVRPEVYGGLYFVFRVVGSPSLSYKNIVKFAPLFNKVADVHLSELKRNKAIITVHYLNGFLQTVNNCRFVQGNYASIPTVWGLPLAKVNHPKCQARGDDSCVYEITWINRPSRLFGCYGLIAGAAAAAAICGANWKFRIFEPFIDIVLFFVLPVVGYLIGQTKDYRAVINENRELYEGQNKALLNSIKEIEELNVGLQKKVEERTEELSIANQKLERTYAELKENETRLVQSEKMASLGRLIAGIAHEVNTPAGVIKSSASYILSHIEDFFLDALKVEEMGMDGKDKVLYIDIIKKTAENALRSDGLDIKEEQKLREKIKEMTRELNFQLPEGTEKILAEFHLQDELVRIADLLSRYDGKILLKTLQNFGRYFVNLRSVGLGTERISELVKALKVYSHLDQSRIEEVDIREGIETSLVVLKNELKAGIEVVKNFSVLPKVTCYVNELNQVWTNIILNACEVLNGKGRITIETYEKGGMVAVKITDNGPGIPPQILPKIFEPFFTTKPKGNGLGLGICQQVIDKHNGRINVESEPGRTSFEVVLPLKMKMQVA